jgi:hypothetical protein
MPGTVARFRVAEPLRGAAHVATHPPQPSKQQRADGGLALVHAAGDLRRRPTFQIAQPKRRPRVRWKVVQRGLHRLRRLAHRTLSARRPPRRNRLGEEVARKGAARHCSCAQPHMPIRACHIRPAAGAVAARCSQGAEQLVIHDARQPAVKGVRPVGLVDRNTAVFTRSVSA